LIDYQKGQSHTDLLIHNQLVGKQQRIIANNKVPPGARIPSGNRPRLNQNPSEASVMP